MDRAVSEDVAVRTPAWTRLVVACAGAVGIALMAQAATVSSATYDETAYLRIAADWWRTGESSEMTRMGSPVTFFKLQAAPAFFVLDRIGLGGLIDRPVADQPSLLPIVRMSSLWIWLAAFLVTASWSRRMYGPRAMAFAASLFALSPNLLAHGSLMTMEMPLVAATVALFFLFWKFLSAPSFPRSAWGRLFRRSASSGFAENGRGAAEEAFPLRAWEREGYFVASAVVAGLAFSCKFTAVVYPPILGLIWCVDLWRSGERRMGRILRTVGPGMLGYVAIMMAVDWAVTGFAVLSASARSGYHPSAPNLGWLLELPIPQDWAGFATQLRHQRNGGPSYLLGERRMTGWWYYYPVALAVKVPLGCWLLILARISVCLLGRGSSLKPSPARGEGADLTLGEENGWLLPLAIAAFLAIAMFASKRNYGVRYLLPMAPLAIVWISALAERRGIWRWIVAGGLIGQAAALATIHPHELSYFNILAGGKIGGRRVLADSNLDWGQGLRSLAVLEEHFRPLTIFYFGDVDPGHYLQPADGYLITATGTPVPLPKEFAVETRYVAVSASLQHGPWGPAGYFRALDASRPVAYTDDGTIAIYDREPGAGRDQ